MAVNFKPCSVSACNGNAHWRADGRQGYCSRHYRRYLAHGDPTAGRVDNGSLWSFLQDTAFRYEGDSCLEWPFGKSDNGYGTVRVDRRKNFVHRIVCEQANGPAPINSDAAHACGNRGCVNPRHLRWASRQENMADAVTHGTILGANRGKSVKLRAEDIPGIRAKLAQGLSVSEIARQYAVSDGCIYSIRSGTNWRWVS